MMLNTSTLQVREDIAITVASQISSSSQTLLSRSSNLRVRTTLGLTTLMYPKARRDQTLVNLRRITMGTAAAITAQEAAQVAAVAKLQVALTMDLQCPN